MPVLWPGNTDGHAAWQFMILEHFVMARAAGADVASVADVAAGMPVCLPAGLPGQLSLLTVVVGCLTGHR